MHNRNKTLGKMMLMIVVILFLAVIIICSIAVKFIKSPNIARMDDPVKKTLHGMEYLIDASWHEVNVLQDEIIDLYAISENKGTAVALVEIKYAGEADLTDGEAAYKEESAFTNGVDEIISGCLCIQHTIQADNAVFIAKVYYDSNVVTDPEELLALVVDSINAENYDNSRISLGLTIEYNGSTEEGTVIDSASDIIVVEAFDTGFATGQKCIDWSIEKPVALKAGEISYVDITTANISSVLEIRCSTELSSSKVENMPDVDDEPTVYWRIIDGSEIDDDANKYYKVKLAIYPDNTVSLQENLYSKTSKFEGGRITGYSFLYRKPIEWNEAEQQFNAYYSDGDIACTISINGGIAVVKTIGKSDFVTKIFNGSYTLELQ